MSKTQYLREASVKLEESIAKLRRAKADLLHARSDQHVRLALALAEIEEIYEILTDPVCTPEMYLDDDVPDPDCGDFDDCRWDGDRIEATKTLLFREHIGRR
ncbi:hypothetical protein [Thermobacillus sp.]|uniref:hypothetical protein n=1 Tax=Thermobacillus sp. TaxID=2108467 RepID=UPI00257F8C97|nr:hypothetical protein [Thermobacillus sp.]